MGAFYLTIQDITGPRYFAPDVVPQSVMDAFQAQITQIQGVYQQKINDPSYTFTAADFQTLQDARETLISYADKGVPLPLGGTGYLNQSMAKTLDTLLKTFDIAGFGGVPTPPAGAPDPANYTGGTSSSQYQTDLATYQATTAYQNYQTAATNAVNQWSDLSVAGLGEYIGDALNAVSSGRSIQAMIELEYIKAGNDLITNKLSGLQSALSLTQNAMGMLTQLQTLANKVTPITQTAPSITGTGDSYVNNFKSSGNAVYNQPIPVQPSGVSSADRTMFSSMTSTSGPLYQAIVNLLPQFGNYSIADLGPPPVAALDGTLPQALFQVYQDMTTATADGNGSRLTAWLTDHMGAGGDYNSQLAGNYSTDLTTAQTAAGSLNDQQKQNVQQALFLFQEFYQSGSGMLTQINQIIQSMAQAAGQ